MPQPKAGVNAMVNNPPTKDNALADGHNAFSTYIMIVVAIVFGPIILAYWLITKIFNLDDSWK